MSTLRFDVTTSDWVVFAPSRKLRPHELRRPGSSGEPGSAAGCPFCPGNEAFTPPEIYRVPGRDGTSPWSVRVFPNKFPALKIEENPTRMAEDGSAFQYMGGCGAHEVIVESPAHATYLAQQPLEQIELLLRTLQLRYQDLMRDRRFQTVVIFKNHGVEAGTSLAHPHWQLIATPVVPRLLRLKHIEATEYFDRMGECLYTALLRAELAAGCRVVVRNKHFVALMPYASHTPFETWILPTERQSSFMLVDPEHLRSLAVVLKEMLLKLYTGLDNPAFNLTIDDVPRGDEDKEYFLWHIRIIPRLSTPAGFELGSGMSINTVLPEDAAAFLSEVPVAVEATR
jgi:UDPglucose--hexose-1-phosphate uridylyltransferase